MNDTQENKYSMYIKVQSFLGTNAATLAAVTPIAGIKTQLDGWIEDIATADGLATADTSGFTQQKATAETDLRDIMLKVSRAAAAYFASIGNPGMIKLADYLPSELLKLRDTALYVKAKQLFAVADPVKANLTGFNSGPADVTTLNDKKEDFFDVLQLPENKRVEKTSSGKDVDDLMDDVDDKLKTLDIYLDTFAAVNMNLYNQYIGSRAIDDTGSSGGGSGTVLQTVQNTIAAAATVNIATVPTGTTKVNMKVLGGGPLRFGLSLNGTTFDGNPISLGASGQTMAFLADFASAGTNFLVKNLDGGNAGEYEVKFLG